MNVGFQVVGVWPIRKEPGFWDIPEWPGTEAGFFDGRQSLFSGSQKRDPGHPAPCTLHPAPCTLQRSKSSWLKALHAPARSMDKHRVAFSCCRDRRPFKAYAVQDQAGQKVAPDAPKR